MTVALLLAPDVPVDDGALEGFCAGWSRSVGSDVVPCRCRDLHELVSLAVERGGHAGVVVDPGRPVDRRLVESLAVAPIPVALVSTRSPRGCVGELEAGNVFRIEGRGVDGYRWAVRAAHERSSWPLAAGRYGDDPEQTGDLRLPRERPGPHATVVLLHGGGWRERWERDLMDGLAVDLARRGYATWNLEFRRVGPSGGGWRATFDDVAAGIDHLRELARRHPLDLGRVVVSGHSAGGHLAVSAAHPRRAPRPAAARALDRRRARHGRGGVARDRRMSGIALLGGLPDEHPDRYAFASPRERLPLGTPQLLVHGTADRADLIDLNLTYADAARQAGDDVELVELPGANHFDVIDPRSLAWRIVRDRLDAVLGPGGSTVTGAAR